MSETVGLSQVVWSRHLPPSPTVMLGQYESTDMFSMIQTFKELKVKTRCETQGSLNHQEVYLKELSEKL